MESSTLQVRRGDEEIVECWDDDEDLQCYEDIQLRTASSATSVTNSSIRRSGHRDSISSRRSGRSDLDSNAGGDEDWQVQLLDNEEGVSEEAIASAQSAGIPLPTNLPRSALVGGTIKRLGRRKPKQNFDDWSEDMEFPGPEGVLELKCPQESTFPESLRQISSVAASPIKPSASPFWGDDDISFHLQSALANLDSYQIDDSVNSVDDIPTIRAPGSRSPQRAGLLGHPKPDQQNQNLDNFEEDFEIPANGFPLQLSHRKVHSRITSPTPDDIDVDWSEGSIGVRFGGTTRDHRSNPSSSVSVVSPSASSCLTAESEDEGLEGLIIPEGPLDLETSLRKRQEPRCVSLSNSEPVKASHESANPDNFFSGIEIEGDDTFDSKRLSINPNVKCKTERPSSPVRRSATTLTFTPTTVSPKTRIPRLSGHDRPHSTHLETVSESGAPLSNFRSPPSRTGGHSSHMSLSSLATSGCTSMPPITSTPSMRLVGTRAVKGTTSSERITAGNQLLKKKRSMPSMRSTQQAALSSCQRSPSRQEGPSFSSIRPKTPVDRTGGDPRSLSRRSQAPFIPAGASENQSHHASVKNYRQPRRTNSDSSNDTFTSQAPSRMSRSSRHDAFSNAVNDSSPETLIASTKRTLTRPARRRNFGDGTELASFDDLPTSTSTESRFVKLPSGRGAPRSLRSRLNRSHTIPSRIEAPTPQQPVPGIAPKSQDSTPRFARDTNASRNAREQRIASMAFNAKSRESQSFTSLNAVWKTQTVSRVPSSSSTVRSRKGRQATMTGFKPHLIKPLGAGVQEPKSINGMQYNPAAFRWEGNEGLIQGFETDSPKSPKPAPALITNVGAMQNVQVVGGMVFDPRRMCWLKMAPLQPGTKGLVAVQDEDDVFAGLGDLEDKAGNSRLRNSSAYYDLGFGASGDDRSCGDSSDEWPMTEEFDVGPEFIRRQRAEEEKWRRKVDKWISFDRMKFGDGWRWAIRDLVQFNSARDHDSG
ncbi:hypothetical protein BDV23DRAFT_53849 [Aspergillus alliaceus]|uniref:Cytokinesis regulator n=1 Tax=Petromyces alliaceus TaxID=209559 RepID=A0A5N7CG57_PETAA|nr:hypothetical protein BDV23DRAFT_53849 [Aspergillus alliaceus]